MESRRTKPPKIDEMTKEQIRNAIIKKREWTARALRVVESLLEPGTSEELLLRSLPLLNQSHLDDVVEERAITLTCGYPPCANQLSKKDIPKQQYRISMKTNKVYDITGRKKFCSNRCYDATMYVKNQMLTSPLWFREYEEIPFFHLMASDMVPRMGKEVDLSLIETISVKKDQSNFTSISEFAKASFNEMDGTEDHCSVTDDKADGNLESAPHTITTESDTNLIKETSNEIIDECTEQQDKSNSALKFSTKSPKEVLKKSIPDKGSSFSPVKTYKDAKNQPNIIGSIVEHPERKKDPIICSTDSMTKTKLKVPPNNTTSQKTEDTIVSFVIHVEKCVAEWFTLDSMILLLGEAKLKEMVADKGDCIKEYLNNMANGLLYSSTSYDQYQQLCRKLNMLELEDQRYDSKVIIRETKPLPDYSIIKEEGKRMELKVKAYLSGECDFPEPTKAAETQSQEEDPSNLTQLALVDKKAQNSLRRKILLTNLNRVLHDLQRSLGIQGVTIASDVRLLANSFKLKANNIMFKPIQWTLIGIIVIKLLSLRDARLQQALESPAADRNLQLLLLSYKQDGGYLDRLLLWLTDIDRLLDTTHTQLTIQRVENGSANL